MQIHCNSNIQQQQSIAKIILSCPWQTQSVEYYRLITTVFVIRVSEVIRKFNFGKIHGRAPIKGIDFQTLFDSYAYTIRWPPKCQVSGCSGLVWALMSEWVVWLVFIFLLYRITRKKNTCFFFFFFWLLRNDSFPCNILIILNVIMDRIRENGMG